MTFKVTATCEWCLTIKTTTLAEPLPEGWLQSQILDVKLLAQSKCKGDFCCQEHIEAYAAAAPLALEAAAKDYVQKFYSSMNEVRPAK